jgi:hypothetical protein
MPKHCVNAFAQTGRLRYWTPPARWRFRLRRRAAGDDWEHGRTWQASTIKCSVVLECHYLRELWLQLSFNSRDFPTRVEGNHREQFFSVTVSSAKTQIKIHISETYMGTKNNCIVWFFCDASRECRKRDFKSKERMRTSDNRASAPPQFRPRDRLQTQYD